MIKHHGFSISWIVALGCPPIVEDIKELASVEEGEGKQVEEEEREREHLEISEMHVVSKPRKASSTGESAQEHSIPEDRQAHWQHPIGG